MCSLCGAIGHGPAWEQEGIVGSGARWQLQREAAATAEELNTILGDVRIKVSVNANFGFLVDFPTGGTDIVLNLAQLWHLLERRGVALADPLGE